jgi:IS605 OrfB family transposase
METTLHTHFTETEQPTAYALLDMTTQVVGDHMGSVFKKLYVQKTPEKDVKRWVHTEGFSHRIARGLIVDVKGRVDAQTECQAATLLKYQRKLRQARAKVKDKGTPYWKHKVARLEQDIAALETEMARPIPSFCFGSKALFRKQHALAENGLTMEQWQEAWWNHRHEQFLCVGSSDETMGNQTCQVRTYRVAGTRDKNTVLHVTVRLKLPACVCDSWIDLPLTFSYGGSKLKAVLDALERGESHCLSWRFLLQRPEQRVRVFVSFTAITPPPRWVPHAVMASDCNEGFLETAVVCRKTGNRIWHWRDPFIGASPQQTRDNLNKIIRNYMALCKEMHWAFGYEDLDFEAKKAQDLGTRMNKMLSQWLTGHYADTITRYAERYGVLAVKVNPAYTSVIGYHKFSVGYGWSTHEGAAVAIARRVLRWSERVRSTKPAAVCELAKIRAPHVWRVWARAKHPTRIDAALVGPRRLVGHPHGRGTAVVGSSCRPPGGP